MTADRPPPSLPTSPPPLPVTLLTGFLGAGKTTFLRRLLAVAAASGQRIGVVMNELGQAGIDAAVDSGVGDAGAAAAAAAAADRAFVELTEGCVCCTRNPDLIAALEEMWRRGDLDRVIVETTGLADPLPLTWTLSRPDLAHAARLDAVVTVVDAANEARTRVAEWDAQVACADLIVLSKLDLVDAAGAERARRAVHAVNPHARLLDGAAALPLGVVLDAASAAVAAVAAATASAAGSGSSEAPAGGRHSDWSVLSLRERGAYAANPLEDLLETLPREVFRAKGIVRVEAGRWSSFHVVGGRLELEPDVPAPAHGESRIVLFGQAIDRAHLTALFAACRA